MPPRPRVVDALLLALALCALLVHCAAPAPPARRVGSIAAADIPSPAPLTPSFWPLPAHASAGSTALPISPNFALACDAAGHCPPTLLAAFNRAVPSVLGVPALPRRDATPPPGAPALRSCSVLVAAAGGELPAAGDDESYALSVDVDGACRVQSASVWGALHALTTLAQACAGAPGATRVLLGVPLRVRDAPRFGYRGLLLDTARHYLPLPALLRTLDAMAMSKLNVLHWHLTDAEAFPLALPGFEQFSDAAAFHPRAVYRPADVAAVVEHARARGIRVVPEIDVPAHGAWGRAMPQLVACDDTLDPTSDAVYAMLSKFLVAVSAQFPDAYLFLGGDEVDPQGCWAANPRIAKWLEARNATADALQPYFWRRVWRKVLPALRAARGGGDTSVVPGVWLADDVAIPLRDLPAASYVNAWQGGASLAAATAAGVATVASGAWYLDTVAPPPGCAAPYATHQLWRCCWAAEPAANLSGAQASHLLGGQVSVWTEGVSAATLDARVWPRAAAAAERLWSRRLSAAQLNATAADAEERLDVHVCRLNKAGIASAPIRAGFCDTDLGDDVAAGVEAASAAKEQRTGIVWRALAWLCGRARARASS